MKKPMFDVWDHFKGDYRPPKKDDCLLPSSDSIYDLGQVNDLKELDEYFIKIFSNHIDEHKKYYNVQDITSGATGSGQYILEVPKGYSYVPDWVKKEIYGEFDGCIHEPIDVGFSAPKMVCKKCDKDL